MPRCVETLRVYAEAIQVAHSVFALPFALSSAFIAQRGFPDILLLGKIVVAIVLARTAAMSFNRWSDADIDALNPRTRGRPVPSGRLTKRFMAVSALAASAGFVLTCGLINRLALFLSPAALLVLLGYSYTKRFTPLSHIVLGVALGLSPLGAWIAVREEVALVPVVLGAAVVCWTAGFDIIYACQDADFDARHGLCSIPARLGIPRALLLARALHALTLLFLVAVGVIASLGAAYAAGVAAVAALLFHEHRIVRANDLSRVNVAFFTINGLVSLVFLAGVLLETVL